ncbi:helix-turn-helix domain-containing protein [Amycolatopsis halotolerans]
MVSDRRLRAWRNRGGRLRCMAKEPQSEATRELGVRVRDLREQQRIGQEELARRAGVHWTFVSQVERGLRNLNLHNLLKFAAGLGADPAELVRGLRPPEN